MILLIVLTVPAVLLLLAGWLMFRFAVTRKGLTLPGMDEYGGTENPWLPYIDRWNAATQELSAQEMEPVTVISDDGLELHARLWHCSGTPRRVVLLAHGYRADWLGDFCAAGLRLHEEGCDLLFIDERSHGESEGKYICYGAMERYDVRRWSRFLEERYGAELPVYLMGLSMGCASVLMAAGLDLPENVKGIIADCGFTSPREIFEVFAVKLAHLPAFPLVPVLGLFCRRVAGFDPETSTLDALADCRLPILFVHGDADDFVPTGMTVRNFEAYQGPKDLLLTAGVGHAASFLAYEETYMEHVRALFARCEEE